MTARGAIVSALGAAVLFGASTPLASLLLSGLSPLMLAALLYLGSGIGLTALRALQPLYGARPAVGIRRHDWPWLAGSIISGGILAPTLLMVGLSRAGAAGTSLLLNLEPALTALLAWTVFREHAGQRLIVGMVLIIAGCVVLGAGGSAPGSSVSLMGAGAADACIALACLGWALDNNLTRRISHVDASYLASIKGLAAGTTNLLLALLAGQSLPSIPITLGALLIGLFCFGLSLVLFIRAMRGLGSARAGAYFAAAPFIGAAIAVLWLHAPAPVWFWIAAALMAAGIWLHLTEDHEHEHLHEGMTHAHAHTHDLHHQHAHAFAWNGVEPHVHEHAHPQLRHRHAHYPDLHHRHRH